MAQQLPENEMMEEEGEEDEEGDELQDWGEWRADGDSEGEGEDSGPHLLCLFCDSRYSSCAPLFDHCRYAHRFDFFAIKKALDLDFYGSFKLLNYVRSQVGENRCWSCGILCKPNEDLKNHSHETVNFEDIRDALDDDKYLKPVVQDDPLLYSFDEDEVEDDCSMVSSSDQEKRLRDLQSFEEVCSDSKYAEEMLASDFCESDENGRKAAASSSNGFSSEAADPAEVEGIDAKEHIELCNGRPNGEIIGDVGAKEVKRIDESYFGSYSSFSIHREMINDKIRMDAYRGAILNNPSLLEGAVVMDVGCGTGILSLFAAQAGASKVIAIEASDKMAKVATQIARENGLLRSRNLSEGCDKYTGVIKVVQGMVEELENCIEILPQSVDVLLSEWMGYCLLYESMLSSVLLARDRWLKPGGAILPDTATIFAAGFGRGGTSIPFWENVYGFNMSCIGSEVVQHATRVPIVDTLDSSDLVTNAVALQSFDLARMKPNDLDFTASIELEPKFNDLSTVTTPLKTQCYGVVLWFETGFTSRFCKELPTVLSTSPYTRKTHWSQTILTFREPITLASGEFGLGRSSAIGTDDNPALKLQLRISIARAAEHRAIDISLEITGISSDGKKHCWPPQIFNLN